MTPALTDDRRGLAGDNVPFALSVRQRMYPCLRGEAAADADAEALLALVRAAALYDPARGVKFTTYAWRGIRHQLNWWWKRRRRLQSREETTPFGEDHEADVGTHFAPAAAADPDGGGGRLARAEFWDLVQRVLKPRQWSVVESVYLRGATQESLADAAGVSRQSVSMVMKSALRQLRRALESGQEW